MQKINLPQAAKLTNPNPVSLVCTLKPDGGTNLATVSWWTYLSFNPNMIAYAMAKTSYSGEMVRKQIFKPARHHGIPVLNTGNRTDRMCFPQIFLVRL